MGVCNSWQKHLKVGAYMEKPYTEPKWVGAYTDVGAYSGQHTTTCPMAYCMSIYMLYDEIEGSTGSRAPQKPNMDTRARSARVSIGF